MQVANPAVKKIFNVNFNAPSVLKSGDIYSATHGASKLFMRALIPANPVPVISHINYNGGTKNVTNYQTTISGQTGGTFLHLFELAGSAQASMAASSHILSADGREQGAEINAGARRWIV